MKIKPSSLSLGGQLLNRQWLAHGYGLGLMIGELKDAGKAIGHSGGGPNSIGAIYHFPDHERPVTIASFCQGDDDNKNEKQIAQLARQKFS